MKSLRCRGCSSTDLNLIFDFGEQPLAGCFPLKSNTAEPVNKYPLDLTCCNKCGLMQVTNMPPIKEVFHTDYRYSSSTIPALVRHFSEYKEWLAQYLMPGAKIFEFGCNDGVFLEQLQNAGYECKGIDASNNVAEYARSKGLDVATGFLTSDYVMRDELIESYDLVTCSNVFAHIHDIHTVIESARLLLKPDGYFAIEVHDGGLLISELQFDTIYHEHLTYFTESTLKRLLESNGFQFVKCEKTNMHGGSLRFLARKSENNNQSNNEYCQSAQKFGINPHLFKDEIERCRDDIIKLYKGHGSLLGYGAAGRSQMFINFTNTSKYFSCIFDDSPLRQGRYIAGTDLPIMKYSQDASECCVILAWNYAEDIFTEIKGKFKEVVTLLPELKRWT